MPAGVNVGHNITLPTHDVSLSNGQDTFGMKLENGVQSMIEQSQTASTLLNRGGAGKWGDYDPTMAQIEQRTYIGGRGSKDFSGDTTRFWDSKNLFSMIDGKLFPAPQWKVASGLRTSYEHLPGSVSWQPMFSSWQYLASSFTVGSSSVNADNVCIWLRRVGSPGTLTVEIWTDSAGEPGALVTSATASITTSTITDYISEFYSFDVSAAAALSASTTYWVVARVSSTDNRTNHWEVGVDESLNESYRSSDGSTWDSTGFKMYYRVLNPKRDYEFKFFSLYGALMAVDVREDASNSVMYLNGEIGVVTSGTTTTLTDTNMGEDGSWTNDQWNGWYVKVVSGTAKGKYGLITDTTSAGVLTVDFDVAPAAGDVYVIYGGPAWIVYGSGTTGLGAVKDIAVMNNVVYFAQGASDNIRRMTYASASHTFVYADDSTNKADALHVFQDPVDGPVIWRGENDTVDVSRADAVSWGNDLTFGTAILVGDTNTDIINIIDYDKRAWIAKEDGWYTINNDRAEKLNVGLDFIKSKNNGQAAVSHKLFLMFSWGDFTVQRYYSGDLSSIGYERNYGLPSDRKGRCTALHSHPAGLYACVDGGDNNYSSILVREETSQGWHEIFRAPVVGWRVRNMYWQDNRGTNPILWFDCNGELFYQEWPANTFNPLEDSNITFQHEAVVETADIDMNAAKLPKALKEFNLISENLQDGIEVFLDYQVDNDIDSGTWTPVGRFVQSPFQALRIGESGIRRVRFRLRMYTNDASTPPIVIASVLEGVLRTPFKRQWTFRVRTSDFQVTRLGVADAKPDDLLEFLYDAARNADALEMRTLFKLNDGVRVLVDPPVVRFNSVLPQTQSWSGTFEFTVREE